MYDGCHDAPGRLVRSQLLLPAEAEAVVLPADNQVGWPPVRAAVNDSDVAVINTLVGKAVAGYPEQVGTGRMPDQQLVNIKR
jgi:hypothetical protein